MKVNPMLKVLVEEEQHSRNIYDLQDQVAELMCVHFDKAAACNRAANRVRIVEAEVRLAKARAEEALAELKHLKAVESYSNARCRMERAEADMNEAHYRLSEKRVLKAVAAE